MSKKPDQPGNAADPHGSTSVHAQRTAKRPKPLFKLDVPNELSLASESRRAPGGADPYNVANSKPQPVVEPTRTRSLDDLRRLSEAIKTTPQWMRPQKTTTSAMYRRLEELRVELQRALKEVQAFREGGAGSDNRHVIELMGKLRDATFHLEGAVKCLTALEG